VLNEKHFQYNMSRWKKLSGGVICMGFLSVESDLSLFVVADMHGRKTFLEQGMQRSIVSP